MQKKIRETGKQQALGTPSWRAGLPLRERYIYTRHNKLRLRYILAGTVFIAAGFSTLVSWSGPSAAIVQPYEIALENVPEQERIDITPKAYELAEDMAAVAVPRAKPKQEEERPENLLASLSDHVADNLFRSSRPMIVPPQPPQARKVVVKSGDTITGVLQRAGIGASQSYRAVEAMKTHYDPRRVRPGARVSIKFGGTTEEGVKKLASMAVRLDATRDVVVSPSEDGYSSKIIEKELVKRQSAKSTVIETSLYGSGARDGIPSAIIGEAIRAYSWNVDFQRQIRKGDKLQVLYDIYETPEGEHVKYGKIHFAKLTVAGEDLPIYRYEMTNGDIDYFSPDGQSVRKALMKTPLDGGRVSSGYGMRKHPILGYNKMHKGVDFAAPTGTPIYAAGDGVIEKRGTWGAYGKYIRVRHNSALKTAYAHLHKYKKGVGVGSRVKQGDIIGYVGSTGRSTGPHLHYEVIENGKQVNPNKVDLPTGEILKGKEKKRFQRQMRKLDDRYVSLYNEFKVAQRGDSKVYR